MTVVLVLITLSLLLALSFLAAFLWAVKSGQYDDTFTPSMRILLEDGNGTAAGLRNPLIPLENGDKNKIIQVRNTKSGINILNHSGDIDAG